MNNLARHTVEVMWGVNLTGISYEEMRLRVTPMPNLSSLVLVPAWLILFFYATCQAHEKQNLTVVSVHIT